MSDSYYVNAVRLDGHTWHIATGLDDFDEAVDFVRSYRLVQMRARGIWRLEVCESETGRCQYYTEMPKSRKIDPLVFAVYAGGIFCGWLHVKMVGRIPLHHYVDYRGEHQAAYRCVHPRIQRFRKLRLIRQI